MLAPAPVRSIDALLEDDPSALDDSELKANLCDFASARARLDAAEAATIAEFDGRNAFVDEGAIDSRAWLAHHTGVSRKVAGSRVWLAKHLRSLPLMLVALTGAQVTDGHARALARCSNPRTTAALARDEALLVSKAIELEVDEFQQVLDHWLLVHDPSGREPDSRAPSVAHLSPMLEGRMRLDAEFDLADAVEVRAEIEARYEELYRQDHAAPDTDPLKKRTRSERMAAAMVEVMRRSSAAGDTDWQETDTAEFDAAVQRELGRPKSRPRRPLIIAVVDVDPLRARVLGPGRLDDGTPLPPAVLEQWACDSPIGRVLMKGKSVPIDVGTLTYVATGGQRRALIARDRKCILPGCNRKARWCDAHHVVPWPNGPTNLSNLVLMCKRHHKQVHAEGIQLLPGDSPGHWIVADRHGTPLRERPPPSLVV